MRQRLLRIVFLSAAVVIWLMIFDLLGIIKLPLPERSTSPAVVSGTHRTSSPTLYQQLASDVVPTDGISIPVRWADMGRQLIDAGAIDLTKVERSYGTLTDEQKNILTGAELGEIRLTPANIALWTNVLWSLGLTQRSKVLAEGLMSQRADEVAIASYASTGGWTLGRKAATELFNSTQLLSLTSEEENRVARVAEHVYRPCCANATAYPDCNHGMAVLGLLELLASQGATEAQMIQAAFAFNRYAFPNQYIVLAAYFAAQRTAWPSVDASTVLGAAYSSSPGFQRIAAQVGPIDGAPNRSGSCSA